MGCGLGPEVGGLWTWERCIKVEIEGERSPVCICVCVLHIGVYT